MATPAAVKNALAVIPELEGLEALVKSASREITKSLPHHLRPERIMQIALTCVRLNPELAKCTPASFLGALFVSAQLGLEPVAGNAYILPFNNSRKVDGNYITVKEAQFIIGYRGLASLFYRHDKSLGLSWGVVHEKDDFDYQYGTGAFLRHKPVADRGGVKGYYVVASLQGGDKPFLYMTKEECLEHGKKHSKTFDKKTGEFMSSSPWAKEFDAMAKKTVLIQFAKTLPLSIELQQAIQTDETSREYREGVDDILDISPAPWEEPVIDTDSREAAINEVACVLIGEPTLAMGSPLHKAIEAMIGEEGWDRVLLHEYLMQQGKIEMIDGKPSFSTMKEEFARNWLDKRETFRKTFQAWLDKGQD